MEPLTLIVTAVIAGATVALKDTASLAVKDAYKGLKELIHRRFAGRSEAELVLAQVELKPDVWREPLQDALQQTAAEQDGEIIEAAQKLMSLVEPRQAAAGKYVVQIAGNAPGMSIGDGQHVTNHFGSNL